MFYTHIKNQLNVYHYVMISQELKKEYEVEQTRKSKDNGHREKENSLKNKQKQNNNGHCEAKCNIQKGKEQLKKNVWVFLALVQSRWQINTVRGNIWEIVN